MHAQASHQHEIRRELWKEKSQKQILWRDLCRRYELGATKKFAGVLDAEVNGGEEVNRARQFGSCVFTPRPTENGGVVTRTSVPPFFGRVRSPARSSVGSASKMIVLMPRLRKRPPARESGAPAAGKEGGGDFFFPRYSSVERSRIIVYIMNMRSERGEVQYRSYSLAGIGGAQILNSLTISFGNAASGISSELGLWMGLNLFYQTN